IDLTKGAFFNYEGVGASQFVMILPLMFGPVLLYLPFSLVGYPWGGIAFLAIVGVIGIFFRNYLLDFVANQFEKRRYSIVTGFREQ
ncbi:MAG: DUF5687 family protein, partial [Bacteroidota bacterium]